MTIADALKIRQDYYDNEKKTADDEFMYTEALTTLIRESGKPEYMAELAWYYCGLKRFDLEIKYLEMAAECGYGPAYEELGYMWYYGQHGEKDYKKAFVYYTKGAEPDKYGNHGSLWCKYKLADMYRYGCAVEVDIERYVKMIEEAYEEVKNAQYLNEPYPEIALRYAGILNERGNDDEAVALLKRAKRFLAERLAIDPFWGHIEVMGRIVRFLYKLTRYVKQKGDFYDLFYLTETPGRYMVKRGARKLYFEVTEENGEKALCYDGRWYRNFSDFCQKATIDGVKFTSIYDEFSEPQRVAQKG